MVTFVVKFANALLVSVWTLSLGPALSARSWLLIGPNLTPNRRSRLSINLEHCCLLIGRERTILAPDWPLPSPIIAIVFTTSPDYRDLDL